MVPNPQMSQQTACDSSQEGKRDHLVWSAEPSDASVMISGPAISLSLPELTIFVERSDEIIPDPE